MVIRELLSHTHLDRTKIQVMMLLGVFKQEAEPKLGASQLGDFFPR